MSTDEQEQKTGLRRLELSSGLARLSLLAADAYYLLLDKAKPVADVPRSYPLRRQQVYGNVATNQGYIAADYLMINLGEHHNLTLYRNFSADQPFAWRHTRSKQVGELICEETKLEEAQNTSAKDQNVRLNLEVSLYEYPKVWGENARFVKNICGYSNNYFDAEHYIPAFEADLNVAITRYQSET